MTCVSLTLCKPRISAEGYWRKQEMQVASKKVHWKKHSASPSNYSEIFNPPPSPPPQAGRRGVHALELHLKYGRGSESTSGYKNKCKWRSSNYLLILIKLLLDSRQIYPED